MGNMDKSQKLGMVRQSEKKDGTAKKHGVCVSGGGGGQRSRN